MNHHRQLEAIAAEDPLLTILPTIQLAGTHRDAGHAQRRIQQRGISRTKLRIALAYGRHDHHHGQQRWTLLGRSLLRSPYARFCRELEGLQLIGAFDAQDGALQLKTCKWVWAMRRH
ncbi:DUF4258 domain-containing protein [Synechococcus sp. CCAP 1479/9]|uniref:DUF4258 domain-containing protein n=1 Tax=Synechococcus sp. CCAP 1479/9 TaxID=1221593 RepID=UPI001C221F81|nr:DUF4258 domain-containing protein [Synechococcus sp. CCAP 1479/9]